jgi:hypothetical protein
VRAGDERGVVVEAGAAASFVVIESELALELAVAPAARPPVRVRPPARDQLPVPAKQRLRLEEKTVQAGRGIARLSDARSARSARVNVGREDLGRRIASSWRRTTISNSFERRGHPSSHTRANRFRTTRYTNDQSTQPPSDDETSAGT